LRVHAIPTYRVYRLYDIHIQHLLLSLAHYPRSNASRYGAGQWWFT